VVRETLTTKHYQEAHPSQLTKEGEEKVTLEFKQGELLP
jgi:argininosuccinate synthase